MLTIKNQFIPRLASVAKKLREKSAEREKADIVLETTSKGRMKRATTANKRVTTLEAELASAKASRLRRVVVATRAESDANNACTDFEKSQARLVEVEQEARLDRGKLDEVRDLSAGSAKAAEKTLRHLTRVSNRA